jgi:hypothetical protein
VSLETNVVVIVAFSARLVHEGFYEHDEFAEQVEEVFGSGTQYVLVLSFICLLLVVNFAI